MKIHTTVCKALQVGYGWDHSFSAEAIQTPEQDSVKLHWVSVSKQSVKLFSIIPSSALQVNILSDDDVIVCLLRLLAGPLPLRKRCGKSEGGISLSSGSEPRSGCRVGIQKLT